MLDAQGVVLYVGKAKNLKKRVTSYFHRQLDAKTLSLVKQVASIEVTVTRNEREALLLESNLIKEKRPRYNIIFRDDKSYPWLKLSMSDSFPRLTFVRGRKQVGGNRYYGPYPSAREAREALNLLQKLFKLRQCDNTFFSHRSRPCVQYQIKRCSAPCVGYINASEYQQDVQYARLFLEGKNEKVIEVLVQKMDACSQRLEYETAATLRNQIALLRKISEHQIIIGSAKNVDVLGVAVGNTLVCIHQLLIREGKMIGTKQYFSSEGQALWFEEDQTQKFLKAFIVQHYVTASNAEVLKAAVTILLPCALEGASELAALISEKVGVPIQINQAMRGDRARWVQMATQSAHAAIQSRKKVPADYVVRLHALQAALEMPDVPNRIECFDISHSLGEATVASCVVFDVNGPLKASYRRFHIRANTGGDDYAALQEGLTRHYTRLKSETKSLPDIVMIDGGKGQLARANAVFKELQIEPVYLLAVAKGPERKPGLETVFVSRAEGAVELSLSPNALLFVQQIRDEAHRFAITAHRKKRAANRRSSSLLKLNIPGIGQKRRMQLLKYFGGSVELEQANREELAKVPGISRALAERIFNSLHS